METSTRELLQMANLLEEHIHTRVEMFFKYVYFVTQLTEKGQYKGSVPHGYGTITYSNGDRYEGMYWFTPSKIARKFC